MGKISIHWSDLMGRNLDLSSGLIEATLKSPLSDLRSQEKKDLKKAKELINRVKESIDGR